MIAEAFATPDTTPTRGRPFGIGRVVTIAVLVALSAIPAHIVIASRSDIEASVDLQRTLILLGLIWAAPLAVLGMVATRPVVERIVSDRYPGTRRTLRVLTIALFLVPAMIVGIVSQAFAGMMLSEHVPLFRSTIDGQASR